jgi:hypothetical protein
VLVVVLVVVVVVVVVLVACGACGLCACGDDAVCLMITMGASHTVHLVHILLIVCILQIRYRILKDTGGAVLVANILKESKRRMLEGEHLLEFNPPELSELLLQRGRKYLHVA